MTWRDGEIQQASENTIAVLSETWKLAPQKQCRNITASADFFMQFSYLHA